MRYTARKLSLMNSIKTTAQNRIASVDIARVLACFTVMFLHLPQANYGNDTTQLRNLTLFLFGNTSYVFFVFAGYFAARNARWKKSAVNAAWCCATFFLWEWLSTIIDCCSGRCPEHYSWYSPFTVLIPTVPLSDIPLWFLRTLTFLLLLTPILSRFSRVLFPLLLICSLIPWQPEMFGAVPGFGDHVLSLGTFTAGCFLQSFSRERQQKFLQFTSLWLIVAYLAFQSACYALGGFMLATPTTLCHYLASVWVFYLLARWVELHVPCAGKIAVSVTPAIFLVYCVHWPIFSLFRLPLHVPASALLLVLYMLAVFIACVLLLELLKRAPRPLLRLIAWYKMPPPERKPTQD